MAKGTIIAQLYTAREALPLENVSVTITMNQNGREELIGYRETDADGKTSPVELETPDREASTSPQPGQPFAACNIRIMQDEYYAAMILDAEVFADEESIQYLELIPLPENAPGDAAGLVYRITPPNL